jgi:hypothetical protein
MGHDNVAVWTLLWRLFELVTAVCCTQAMLSMRPGLNARVEHSLHVQESPL